MYEMNAIAPNWSTTIDGPLRIEKRQQTEDYIHTKLTWNQFNMGKESRTNPTGQWLGLFGTVQRGQLKQQSNSDRADLRRTVLMIVLL